MKLLSEEFLAKYRKQTPKNAGVLFYPIYLRTYSRWLEDKQRRERWDETVERVVEYSLSLYQGPNKDHVGEAEHLYDSIFNLKILPAGRTLWIGGTKAAEKCGEVNYNCSFSIIDSLEAFTDLFHLLLCGCGVGFRILEGDVATLPSFKQTKLTIEPYSSGPVGYRSEQTRWVEDFGVKHIHVGDSREGWVQALAEFLHSSVRGHEVYMNFNSVRPAGERIKGFGGHAPGPEGLMEMFRNVNNIINASGGRLSPVDCMDICNYIGKNVIVGGTRRSSQIALGSPYDQEFLEAKKDLWSTKQNLQRAMSNNSVVFEESPTWEQVVDVFQGIKNNGEPGFSNLKAMRKRRPNCEGSNPCHEILLDSRGFCNLSTVNLMAFVEGGVLNIHGALEAISQATKLGLRVTNVTVSLPKWDVVQKRDRLLGVSLTGVVDAFDAIGLDSTSEEALAILILLREEANKVSKEYAFEMRVPTPLLVTTIKPEGCWTREFTRTTDQGLLFIDEIDPEIDSIRGFHDIRGKGISTSQQAIYKTFNRGPSDIVKVTLNNNRVLKVTPQHPMAVEFKGGPSSFRWREGKDLQLGDSIVYHLGNYTRTEESKLLTRLDRDYRVDAFKCTLPEVMSPRLAWLLGLYWGDGCFTDNNRIKLIGRDLDIHQKAQQAWKELFNVDTSIVRCEDRDAYTQDFASARIRDWLSKNNLDKISYQYLERLPVEIRMSSQESIIAFFAGLSDADGCYAASSMSIDNKSELFIRHLQEVGEAVGISFGFSENKQRQNSHSKKSMFKIHLSRTYSIDKSVALLNKHSVKAQIRPVILSTNIKNARRPYVVKSIEYLTNQENTYDIEVSGSHWYYQGGLKSHNTLSQLPTVSSGLHRAYAPYFIRRVRYSAMDPTCQALQRLGVPNEPDQGKAERIVFSFPIKSDTKIAANEESAKDQFKRYLTYMDAYVDHNASCTLTIGEDEWEEMEKLVFDNFDKVVACAFLPKYTDAFPQMPYEEITKEQYEKLAAEFPNLDSLPDLVNQIETGEFESELEADCTGSSCPVR